MFCTNCGHDLKNNESFCTECGAKQDEVVSVEKQKKTPKKKVPEEAHCAQCGEVLEEGVKFCTECGGSVNAEASVNRGPSSQRAQFVYQEETGFQKVWRWVYPKVRFEKAWHRLVLVIGWLISIMTLWFFPVTFVIYFGIIQRVIYFIAYGDDKSKWLIEK
jgi:hypothetical protein